MEMFRNFLKIFALCAAISLQDGVAADSSYRLPGTTIPQLYKLHMHTRIDLGETTFSGEVDITIQIIANSTQTIVLHMSDSLNLISQNLTTLDNDEVIPLGTATLDVIREFLIISTDDVDLLQGEIYNLRLEFDGELRTDMRGFYHSYYVSDTGEVSSQAVTQFQPTYARLAFPCYDEPEYKAVFRIFVTHGRSFNAISNMEGPYVDYNEDGSIMTTFSDTPKMSTYLVAIVVSDYVTALTNSNGVNIGLLAPRRRVHEMDFPFVASIDILKDMENFFKIPYRLNKIDQIGIPKFLLGAMENWGLVMYREDYLYWDPYEGSFTAPISIATIISHEFSHQWFGNLVTMVWWDYLWLNEGFATLFEYYTVARTYPEYRTMDYMLVACVQNALHADSLDTRPMTTHVNTPAEINQLFDIITYEKAGSVLRMMMYALGEDTFFAAARAYLTENKHLLVTPDHLFEQFEQYATDLPQNVTFTEIMESWTLQPGYPILNVRYYPVYNAFECVQTRFLMNSLGDPNNYKYYVPINYVTQSESNSGDNLETLSEYWMKPGDSVTIFEIPENRSSIEEGEWYLFNKGTTGYYRVNYVESNWNLLIEELIRNPETSISNLNRAQLLDDAFYIWRSGRSTLEIPLNLLEYLVNERDYIPWATALKVFTYLLETLDGTEAYDEIVDLIYYLISPAIEDIGTIDDYNDTIFLRLLRSVLVYLACSTGHDACYANKTDMAQIETSHQLLSFIEKHQIEEFVPKKYIRDVDSPAYISYVTRPLQGDVIAKFINSVVEDGSTLSESERITILRFIATNSYRGLEAVLDLLEENPDLSTNDQLLKILAKRSTTATAFEKLEHILEKYSLTNANEALKYLSTAQSEKFWVDQNAWKITQFLRLRRENRSM